MAEAGMNLPVARRFGETARRDPWWLQPAAVLMSLGTTCKDLGIDPQVYLRDVLKRISTHQKS